MYPIDARAHVPAVFVTSVQVSQTPFLGLLSSLGGNVFVERRKRYTLPGELKEMADLFREGFSVIRFPEGTKALSGSLRPFKSALFRAAGAAEAVIIPLGVRYRAISGELVTALKWDRVFYYGERDFLSDLIGLCRQRSSDVEVEILDGELVRVAEMEQRWGNDGN